ncbi:MAG TPA: UBP-type zinc finger domain-containing protein [Puia sp.]|nr:UBP-type zinc finger domain-containing protein [Puia sp.]
MNTSPSCQHIKAIKNLKTAVEFVCEECIKTGDDWVHLRTCQTCGVTLCCDDSPNTHMTKHNHKTKHPVIISSEPGEQWLWCYTDNLFTEYSL